MSPDRTTAPYGTWPSPVSAAELAAATTTFADLVVDGGDVLWLEGRAADGGRHAVLRSRGDGAPEVLSPDGFDARTRVHEYGGGALGAGHGLVVASSWADHRLHVLRGGTTTPFTPEPQTPAGIRWAQPQVLPGAEVVVAIRETHGPDRPRDARSVHGAEEAVDEVVAVEVATGECHVLVSGPDFVAGPWPNPSGTLLAWLAWDHPDMPWDAAALWVAPLEDGGRRLGTPRHVAGGRRDGAGGDGPVSAVADACWAHDELLLFSDDASGWWNVHAFDGEEVARLQTAEVESGVPRWVHGVRTLATTERAVWALTSADGFTHIRLVDDGPLELDGIGAVAAVASSGDRLVAIAGGPTTPTGVIRIDPATRTWTRLDGGAPDPAGAVGAMPRPITFPTPDGAVAHALHYPPTSATHVGREGERPPLVVLTHGGPTGAARTTVNATAQWWAAHGFAVVDVNYRGSTGYGRAYRDALRGRWGELDLIDVQAAAAHLVAEGHADGDRLLIEGGSAGGYTTLLALCTTDAFAAGGSLFGVSDLTALARDTHKFESRYLDSIVGAWPEEQQVYVDRSPITHVDRLRTPMIVLQGDEDAVVPPSQAEAIVEVLRDRGIAHAYLLFEGEQHGFRRADTIVRAFESRLAFYAHVLGFTPAEDIDLPELVPAREG